MALEFPQIDPVAISLGPLDVRWYALAYLAGFLLGWRYIVYLINGNGYDRLERPIKPDAVDDFLPWSILGVVLGGRIGYILFYQFEFYAQYPMEIIKVWHGGMSFHGGAGGAIVAMVLYSRFKNIPLLKFSDLFCCAVPLGLFFGRIANFINGELFGRVSPARWAMVFPDGGPLPRHPSQLYEAALEGVLLFVVLFMLVRREFIRNHAGIISGVFLVGYGASRFIVEFFREPDVEIGYIMDMFTMGQSLCVPMMIAGFYLVYYAIWVQKPDRPLDSVPAE